MNDDRGKHREREPTFAEQVGAKAATQAQGTAQPHPGVWFGLGMMGLIGWSVVVPTLLGTALGHLVGPARIPEAIPGRWRCWSPDLRSAA